MSANLQKLLQTRVGPSAEAGWPQWIADALAYRPESQAPELAPPEKAAASETNDRRDIRTLNRVLKT
ncbi:hypothetical protein [Bradyrhizobium genosp. SA-3]|uniref:hypothetical protein n=1 Tax=Bradyrhizobium genosp. SA-3 TaxID=508868 RepID=UPI00102A63FC|nr:hypothetical protein [Bradyrhizobium genosp. SA-3]